MSSTDLHKEQVFVANLQFGMFIAELDRPWLESPFLLQGFLLDTEEQMQALKSLCAFVYIDRTKSTGIQFKAEPKRETRSQLLGGGNRTMAVKRITKNSRPTVVVKGQNTKDRSIKETSFFEVMKAVKQNQVETTTDGVVFNVTSNGKHDNPIIAKAEAAEAENEAAPQVQGDGFFKALFKNKAKHTVSPSEARKKAAEDNPRRYQVSLQSDETPNVEQEIAVIYPTYNQSKIASKALFESIANKNNLDLSTVSDVLDNMVDSISRTPDALMWLSKLKDTDDAAYNQALNVSINMMAFSSFLALPKQNIKDLGFAGLLQDLGKVRIPDRVMQKPGRLSPTEFEIAKLHLDETIKIIKDDAQVSPFAREAIQQHHERFDGSGYPSQLGGQQITLHGQIAGIIDTYCAVTTNRVYAKGISNHEALDAIHKMRDTVFSDQIVDQLIQFLGMYPVSSLVELNTGEVGVVIQQNQVRRLQPRIMILLSPEKEKYTAPVTIDLINPPLTPSGEPYQIARAVSSDEYDLELNDFFE